jgi:type II secretory ATPase GspE/PulE/Tfp pilus assembly ATPase PilB-like protein
VVPDKAPPAKPPEVLVERSRQVLARLGYADYNLFYSKDASVTLWRRAGCRKCHQTGYYGRQGIFELMVTGDIIRELVVQRVNAGVVRLEALKQGMITLRQDGWRKVLLGITTIDEVARVTAGDIG